MLGFIAFLVQMVLTRLNMFLNSLQWSIGNSSLRGEVPVIVWVLAGALVGSLLFGVFGAAVGGVTAAVLAEICKGKGKEATYVR